MSFKSIINNIKEIAYPTRCAVCDCFDEKRAVCRSCEKKLYLAFCPRPFNIYSGERRYTALALYKYNDENVKNLIFHMKRNKNMPLFDYVAIALAEKIKRNIPNYSEYILTYIPTRRQAVAERGFDQAQILAKRTALILKDVKYAPMLLRIGFSLEQKQLSLTERESNVSGKFKINDKIDVARNIILIDDVCTTGSSARECVRVLRKNKAENIICLFVCSVYNT